MEQWGEFLEAGGKKMNQSFRIVDEDVQRQGMVEAGFEDIHVEDIRVGGCHKTRANSFVMLTITGADRNVA